MANTAIKMFPNTLAIELKRFEIVAIFSSEANFSVMVSESEMCSLPAIRNSLTTDSILAMGESNELINA